jgi:hypothetical protein
MKLVHLANLYTFINRNSQIKIGFEPFFKICVFGLYNLKLLFL